jgi:hypothetical protein
MKFLVFATLMITLETQAGYPEYQVIEGVNKSISGLQTKFKISKSKKDYRIEEIHFGEKKFALDIQENFFNDQPIPFFELKFKKKKNVKVFALLATSGTSGRSFHYFLDNGKDIKYSGLHPEIFVEDETGDFISVEHDGPRVWVSSWELKTKGFKLIKTEEGR